MNVESNVEGKEKRLCYAFVIVNLLCVCVFVCVCVILERKRDVLT